MWWRSSSTMHTSTGASARIAVRTLSSGSSTGAPDPRALTMALARRRSSPSAASHDDPGVNAARRRQVGPERLRQGGRLAEPGAGDDRRHGVVEAGLQGLDEPAPGHLPGERSLRVPCPSALVGRPLRGHRRNLPAPSGAGRGHPRPARSRCGHAVVTDLWERARSAGLRRRHRHHQRQGEHDELLRGLHRRRRGVPDGLRHPGDRQRHGTGHGLERRRDALRSTCA